MSDYDSYFSGVASNNMSIVMDNGELASSSTNYKWTVDIPDLARSRGLAWGDDLIPGR